jgi:hypothetical protein
LRAHGFPPTKRLSPVVVVFNPGRARRGCKEAWPSSCRRWISVLPFQEECHIATWLWFPTNLRGPGGGGGGREQANASLPRLFRRCVGRGLAAAVEVAAAAAREIFLFAARPPSGPRPRGSTGEPVGAMRVSRRRSCGSSPRQGCDWGWDCHPTG